MTNNADITQGDLIAIRGAEAGDKHFIIATWLKGLRFGNSWYNLIDEKAYFQVYKPLVEAILAKPSVYVKVACLKEDPEVILGYGVFEGPKMHWVQVKKAWRNIGIARSLVPKDVSIVTHLTETGRSILLKKKIWKFNPFLLV